METMAEETADLAALKNQAEAAAALLSAMANPKRLLLLCILSDREMTVNAMVDAIGASQSTVSQHLGRLRALGLVATRRNAQSITYRLASPDVKKIIETLTEIFCPQI